jgi:uncharacterized protein YdhG (YjbR/CyaY superfamily)
MPTPKRRPTRTAASPIDTFLAKLPAPKRAALDQLRATIRAIVPNAEECISYGLPAFRLDGKVVAGFAPTKNGCSYYPFSGSTFATLARELERYEKTKSALHFADDRPLPRALVQKLIATRLAEPKR